VCQYPGTCAAPGETCYDSVDGQPPLNCCDGYECQQIFGGKVCASNRGAPNALRVGVGRGPLAASSAASGDAGEALNASGSVPLGDQYAWPGAQTCSTQGNACTMPADGTAAIPCCGDLECQQIIGGKVCGWPATCAAPGQVCYDSIDGKPPLTCCGDSVCTQTLGGKVCQYPGTCAAPGETCYDSVDGQPPLNCCDGHECQQIFGGKVCASDRG